MVWREGQRLGYCRFGCREVCSSVVRKEIEPQSNFNLCHSYQRLDIFWIESQGTLEEATRLRRVLGGRSLRQASEALEIQVHRVRMQRTFCPPRLRYDKFGIQRVRKPRYDFILQIEKVSEWLFEALGPEVTTCFGIDKLHVHPQPVAATLYRTFERVADVQFTTDLFEINGLAFVGECRVSANNE